MQDEPGQSPPPADTAEEPQEGFGRRYQPRLYLRLLIVGLVAAYAIAFVLENNKQVHVHFVLGTARLSQIWLILLSVGLGLVLGVLLSQLYRRRRRRRD
ncbi:MAG TPA: lipopolysaccharide assembly protein LapA domain-containing protein [Gaiellaceae bacterium]|nr:lipopolysaccharide assembly protein LapA domain-containing protein [Gaiellaceae bacterium]